MLSLYIIKIGKQFYIKELDMDFIFLIHTGLFLTLIILSK